MRPIAALLVFAALATGAAAQSPPATRLSGTVESFDGTMLRVASGSRSVAVAVPPDLPIGAVAERRLADIHAGDYVGSAAVKGIDGRLHALEVHVFRADQRGLAEGHRPMGPPDQTMTNATVAEVAAPAGDGMLHLKYPGGEQTILVGPEARVVAFVAGDRSLLRPGAAVRVFAADAAGGGLVARSIQAEKDGVKPLM